ncbi:MAG: FHA domain-containing protein [Gaiellaceae bacterium]
METFPDLGALSDQEQKDLIEELTEEEQELSYKRRILHGKIDILRAELVNRLRKKHETGDLRPVDALPVTSDGATLVIRSGGGRSGEAFDIAGERMAIGRSPEAEVFLDDVTVSRNHALLVRRRDGVYIDDLGSLNGTYVNRRRIESHKLVDGDELQIGKYKLTYLER